jgi:hypothetical protein
MKERNKKSDICSYFFANIDLVKYLYMIIVCMFVVSALTQKKRMNQYLIICFQKKIIMLICLAVIIVILGSMVAGWLGIKK